MSQIYFSSDWHYGHENLVRGCTKWENTDVCRDFNTLREADAFLIDSINKTVKANDRLYFLGDFVMGSKDNVEVFRRKINCKNIHLILGNHDIHIRKDYNKCTELFNSVQDYLEVKIGKTNFVLFHYPINSWHGKKSTNHSSIHCYGHTHSELNMHPASICVCIDAHTEFRPFHIDEVRDRVQTNFLS